MDCKGSTFPRNCKIFFAILSFRPGGRGGSVPPCVGNIHVRAVDLVFEHGGEPDEVEDASDGFGRESRREVIFENVLVGDVDSDAVPALELSGDLGHRRVVEDEVAVDPACVLLDIGPRQSAGRYLFP